MSEIRLQLEPGKDPIRQLLTSVIILSSEAQQLFAERYLKYDNWHADLSEPAAFWFEGEPAPTFRPHLIGSSSLANNTWLWGWENFNGLPVEVVEIAEKLRDIGDALDSVELTTAQLPVDRLARAAAGLVERENPELEYLYAAMAVSGLQNPIFYRAPADETTFAWFLLDNDAEFTLPPAAPSSSITAINLALASGLVQDHRLAIESYAVRRDGLSLTQTATGVELVTAQGSVQISFDTQNRVTEMSANAASASAPTAQNPKPGGFFSRLFSKS